ncbi:helix-turn-helix transcriptional regulator [Lacrimispora indolis]|uniref:helix-turn-helix transcriptional regulator n=1 Tax=Lacrimispora indolis TaxID=69825 RepID=UPI00045E8C5D|nr:helix-turn-helix transcriptional regulator [Lacrimispora indolis]
MDNNDQNSYIRRIQGERIKECMRDRNIKSNELAEELNYTPQHISYVINGKRRLTKDMAISIADYLNKTSPTKTQLIEMPYRELSAEDKEEYADDVENGFVAIGYDDFDDIDYRYLLCETDCKTKFEHFETPPQKDIDTLLKNGIKAILHHCGYDLDIKLCPDITRFKNIKSNPSCPSFVEVLQKTLLVEEHSSQIIRLSDGKTIDLLPAELYQLFQDYIKAILSITEREIERKVWYDQLKSTK